jgi:hypothetical protein
MAFVASKFRQFSCKIVTNTHKIKEDKYLRANAYVRHYKTAPISSPANETASLFRILSSRGDGYESTGFLTVTPCSMVNIVSHLCRTVSQGSN